MEKFKKTTLALIMASVDIGIVYVSYKLFTVDPILLIGFVIFYRLERMKDDLDDDDEEKRKKNNKILIK